MAKTTFQSKPFTDRLLSRVEEVYKEEAKRIVDRHVEEMTKELNSKMDELLTRVGLSIAERVRVDDYGGQVVITMIKDTK